MNAAEVARITSDALLLTLVLSMPPIVVATLIGVIVALVQAITQIQEQTLSFAVKLVCVSLVLLGTASWMGGELFRYTRRVFAEIVRI
jgi:type III secretion HrpO family protein